MGAGSSLSNGATREEADDGTTVFRATAYSPLHTTAALALWHHGGADALASTLLLPPASAPLLQPSSSAPLHPMGTRRTQTYFTSSWTSSTCCRTCTTGKRWLQPALRRGCHLLARLPGGQRRDGGGTRLRLHLGL